MNLKRLLVSGVVLLSLVVGMVPAAAQDIVSAFQLGDCPFYVVQSFNETEGETYQCGTLFVPEDRSDSSGHLIALQVMIIFSTNPTPPDDPIVYLEGGPGGSAVAGYEFWFTSGLRANRDLILIDQRGTGYSKPSLNCYEMDDPNFEDATAACAERLRNEGVNLAAYNSAENASDISDLLIALDIEKANLFGVSYGTRLALTVMRDHPERIRSVIIDAVFPPHVAGYDEQTVWANRAFEQLFTNCAADAACNAAFPNLRAAFYELVDTLNENPAELEDPDSGEVIELYGDDVVNNFFQELYDGSAALYMPATIYAMLDGDFETDYRAEAEAAAGGTTDISDLVDLESLSDDDYFELWADYEDFDSVDAFYDYLDTLDDDEIAELEDEFIAALSEGGGADDPGSGEDGVPSDEYDMVMMAHLGIDDVDALYDYLGSLDEDDYATLETEAFGFVDSDSEGMFNSVECYEEIYFNSMDRADALSVDVADQIRNPMLIGIEATFADCAIWDIPVAPALEDEPVVSDIPTLVFSGEYDPITPPQWGQSAADYLSNSSHFVFPGIGHGAVDTDDCPTSMAIAFLNDPSSPPDSSCLDAMKRPPFYIPD